MCAVVVLVCVCVCVFMFFHRLFEANAIEFSQSVIKFDFGFGFFDQNPIRDEIDSIWQQSQNVSQLSEKVLHNVFGIIDNAIAI